MNITPGGADPDGIPDGDDTAIFNTNAITSGGSAMDFSIAQSVILSIASGTVTANGGTITNQGRLTFAGSNNSEELFMGGDGSVTLNGGGEVFLVNSSSFLSNSFGLLTNVDNLIHGMGTIQVPMANQGTIRSDIGLLNINSNIDNTGGTIEITNGATLSLSSTISGGTLSSQGGGLLQGGTLNGVTNTGTTIIAQGTTTLQNTITNQGLLTFAGSNNSEELFVGGNGNVTLNGGGAVFLVNSSSFISNAFGLLTNVDNLIHGMGTIEVPMANQGTIRSDIGLLNINSNIDNTGGTIEITNGATLSLSATISGGTFSSQSGGLLRGGTLDGVTNTGTTIIAQGTTTLQNTITNQGTLTFAGSINSEELFIGGNGNVTLNGGGDVFLVNSSSFINNAFGLLTNVDNEIHGGNGATISVPLSNQGVVQAENGVLNINSSIDNAGGTIEINNGATLSLSSTISGGTLSSQAGGLLRGGTLNGVTNTGTTTIAQGTTSLQNTITNQGLLTFAGSNNSEELFVGGNGNVTLNGGGEVFLVNSSSFISNAFGLLTNVDNLIHGGNGANISVPVTNQGIIRADNGVLNLSGAFNTSGTLQVQAAGLNPGQFSVLHLNNPTLGGTLEIIFLNGFLPKTGDVLKPLQIDGTVTGDFSHITFRGIGAGFQVQADIVGGFYQLTALNDATPAPAIISPLSATATVGRPFIYQILSSPAANNYSSSVLPSGLSLDATTGIISGVPTQAGTSQITLNATDNTGTGAAILTLSIQPAPSSGPIITSGMSATGRTGQPFTFQVTTSGASQAARVGAGGLPPGLEIDPITGLIFGTATSDGSFKVTLTVTDGPVTTTGTLQLTFTSDPALPVIVSPQTAALTPGQSFTYTIVAPASSGPSDPTRFALIGTLPAGLTFNSTTGTISGTFTASPFRAGHGPESPTLSGGVVSNVQLLATNSHGTSTISLIFFLAPQGAVNISTRLQVGSNENVLIAGFIITGNAPKRVVIRAIGPSLSNFGIGNALADTTLELHDGAPLLGTNDDWRESQEEEIIAAALAPTDPKESAILVTLVPGSYTAIVAGKNATGIAVVEVYDLGTASLDATSNSKLGNIATRGAVLGGDDAMIGGFIVSGQSSKVIVRAIGPSLSAFGINGALMDPILELKNSNGATLNSNDDWQQGQPNEIQQRGLAPTDSHESALFSTLGPGAYTAIVRGHGANSAGIGLVEVYSLP